jgi:hypothetical protein
VAPLLRFSLGAARVASNGPARRKEHTALAAGIFAGLLGGATLGITTGGLVGALIGMGVPEEEAHHYESEFHAGRTLVTVQAEAASILSRCGAFARAAVPAATV